MRFEKTQKGNPHELTVYQHIHSSASIARFANEDGLVAVRRVGANTIFLAKADNEIFVAKRAWSHGLEHGLFFDIETRFQEAVSIILTSGGEVDHAAITDYLILWSIRAHLDELDREPLQLIGISGSGLTADQEEILETKGAAFVRQGGLVPAHLARGTMAMPILDSNRAELSWVRWRLGRVPDGHSLLCPDAFKVASAPAIPIDPETALLATTAPGPPDEMSTDLVLRINMKAAANARRCVFGHPDRAFSR